MRRAIVTANFHQQVSLILPPRSSTLHSSSSLPQPSSGSPKVITKKTKIATNKTKPPICKIQEPSQDSPFLSPMGTGSGAGTGAAGGGGGGNGLAKFFMSISDAGSIGCHHPPPSKHNRIYCNGTRWAHPLGICGIQLLGIHRRLHSGDRILRRLFPGT